MPAEDLPRPYDLIWPVASRSRGPVKSTVKEEPTPSILKKNRKHCCLPLSFILTVPALEALELKRSTPSGSFDAFETYTRRLLAITSNAIEERPSYKGAAEESSISTEKASGGPRSFLFSASLGELDEQLHSTSDGCRENVEIRTRIARKGETLQGFLRIPRFTSFYISFIRHQQRRGQSGCFDFYEVGLSFRRDSGWRR